MVAQTKKPEFIRPVPGAEKPAEEDALEETQFTPVTVTQQPTAAGSGEADTNNDDDDADEYYEEDYEEYYYSEGE